MRNAAYRNFGHTRWGLAVELKWACSSFFLAPFLAFLLEQTLILPPQPEITRPETAFERRCAFEKLLHNVLCSGNIVLCSGESPIAWNGYVGEGAVGALHPQYQVGGRALDQANQIGPRHCSGAAVRARGLGTRWVGCASDEGSHEADCSDTFPFHNGLLMSNRAQDSTQRILFFRPFFVA